MRRTHHLFADVKIYRQGRLLRAEYGIPNRWHDEGELYMLSAIFATAYANYGAALANLYAGLDNRAVLAEADTLASLVNEDPTIPQPGVGYARTALSTVGTGLAGQPWVFSQPVAAWRATSQICTFTAGGGWLEVRNVFVCTHATAIASGAGQRLLGSLPLLHGPVSLLNGDHVDATFYAGISEP